MKKVVTSCILCFLLINSFSLCYSQIVKHPKLEKVFVGPIIGGGYGYLNFDVDVEKALKNYSPEAIEKIKTLTSISNHPKYLSTDELFFANKLHYHNFICYEVTSFERFESTSGRNLKYKLLWIPFDENAQQPEGIRPTDPDGFYVIMHRMSVKSKQEPKSDLPIISQEDLDAKHAEYKAKNNINNKTTEQLRQTYTVTFLLEKQSTTLLSRSVFYSGVFVEVYDVNNTQNTTEMINAARKTLADNVDLNGYNITQTFIENTTAQNAQIKLNNATTLSDSRTYQIQYR